MQAISEQSRMVRVPINQMGSANRIRKFINQFEQEHERYPSLSELTEHIDLPEEKIVEALAMATTQVSMDAPFTSNEEGSLLDVLPNKNAPSADDLLVAESLSTEVANALASLSEREQIIIKCFFGINQPEMSLEEIGERTGLTRERVRQIKEKAIIRLRKNSLSERLKSFLGK